MCLEIMAARGDVSIFSVFENAMPYFQENHPVAVDRAFFQACQFNQIDTAKALLPYVTKDKDFQHFFEKAAKDGCKDIFLLLLPFCDPKRNSSKALAGASVFGHVEIFEILYPLSNPKEAIIAVALLQQKRRGSGTLLEDRLSLIEKREGLLNETERYSFQQATQREEKDLTRKDVMGVSFLL